MDIVDDAKENIQPLSSGRNATILQASLQPESPQELLQQRKLLEQEIHNYSGDDPLEPWYNYVSWIEQSCPSGGKESGLEEVLKKCLLRFGSETRYFQDPRMVKLHNKFITYHMSPIECYEQLYNAGIGTMVADFYISWAYYYDLVGNTRKADEIFKRGIDCRAQPVEALIEAHHHYGFIVTQRMLYGNDEDTKKSVNQQLHDRRFALTSLRGLRKKSVVGSIRTGAVIKSYTPGTVQTEAATTSRQSNKPLQVFGDENDIPNTALKSTVAEKPSDTPSTSVKSVVSAIVEAAHNRENEKEPGPWNKAHDKKSHKLFSKAAESRDIGFSIHEDSSDLKIVCLDVQDDKLKQPFIYPKNFHNKNKRKDIWETPVTTENVPDVNVFPQYNKIMLYPRPNMEFQPEEWRLYKRLKREDMSNAFVQSRDTVWSNGINSNIRRYPNFAVKNTEQKLDSLDMYHEPPNVVGLEKIFQNTYNTELQTEYQFEELKLHKLQEALHTTNMKLTDMEETVVTTSETIERRKSFYPLRKSIAPQSHRIVRDVNSFQTSTEPCTSQASRIVAESDTEVMNQSSSCQASSKTTTNEVVNVEKSKVEIKKTTGLAFDIFEDPTESIQPIRPSALGAEFKFAQPNVVTAASVFDGDETCSTQIFTNFLKIQSVSTPNAPQKATSRALGEVLKDVTPKVLKELVVVDENDVVSSGLENDQGLGSANSEMVASASSATAVSYSMLQPKQLSTILETSEHGTHTTTSGSTKSSINSPVFEMLESANIVHGFRANELETLEEQSCESSKITNTNLPTLQTTQTDIPIADKTNTSTTGKQLAVEHAQTPANVRFLQKSINDEINAMEAHPTSALEAGNFTRLHNQEDIMSDFVVAPTLFQSDKTETMSKILQASHHGGGGRFADDKTDTFSKVLLSQPGPLAKFQEDKTGTIPFIPFEAPNDPINLDSFEIFNDSPPKRQKFNILSSMESFNKNNTTNINAMDNKSRNMQQDNSLISHLNNSVTKAKIVSQSHVENAIDKLHDYSMPPEFSYIEETQPKPTIKGSEPPKKPMVSSFGGTLRERDESLEMFNKHLVDPPYMQSFNSTKNCKKNSSINELVELSLMTIDKGKSINSNQFNFFNASKLEKNDSVANKFSESMDFIPETQPMQLPCTPINLKTEENAYVYENNLTSSSIYIQKTPTIPKNLQGSWEDVDKLPMELNKHNIFMHNEIDLDQTNQLIENICLEPNVNPFESVLIGAFLDQIDFTTYIQSLPNCEMIHSVPRLHENSIIKIHNEQFFVQKMIGSGAYGVIYSGKHKNTGQRYALKQERPPNLWEFYICLEIKTRITVDDMMGTYFMSIDYAMIGNNASIYLAKYSPYGSLISVSNCIKKYTDKHLDEFIVMVLTCELLDIIDHLHALHIIHADIKADNFLLMRELSYPKEWNSLQLIDFGVSIDMKLFKPGQHFTYANKDTAFKCVEMREGRPWTYQLDLFGLAGVIHVLLFGKYMVLDKLPNGSWMHSSYVPRYFNKDLWHGIFKSLLNVPDCNSLPDLQRLRTQVKEALVEKEKVLKQKVYEFNSVLANSM